jgi:hypothetical protein
MFILISQKILGGQIYDINIHGISNNFTNIKNIYDDLINYSKNLDNKYQLCYKIIDVLDEYFNHYGYSIFECHENKKNITVILEYSS